MNENMNNNDVQQEEVLLEEADIDKNNNQVINPKYMNRKKFNLSIIILVLISILSVGYAVISTTLHLTGDAGIKAMKWSIHFDNVSEVKNTVSALSPATISSKTTRVDFDVTFESPGEEYTFDVDVVNDGTMDAMLAAYSLDGINAQNQDYIDYTITYKDGTALKENDLLKAGEKETLRVKLLYKELSLSEVQETHALVFDCTYVQADESAVERK